MTEKVESTWAKCNASYDEKVMFYLNRMQCSMWTECNTPCERNAMLYVKKCNALCEQNTTFHVSKIQCSMWTSAILYVNRMQCFMWAKYNALCKPNAILLDRYEQNTTLNRNKAWLHFFVTTKHRRFSTNSLLSTETFSSQFYVFYKA